ncbi:hypothetical protein ACFFMM_00230 [Micromonospora chaiyaphumensis]|nr:hypothetical protein [Micromonospora chaiyaphumensis]
MVELAGYTAMAQRESLAGRVRDELALAGLPIVAADMSPHLRQSGAEVRVDKLADCHAPVRVEWRTDRTLQEMFQRVAMAEQVDAPVFRHYQMVVETMLQTMTEILTAAGFTVRGSTNDFAPLTLEILDGPRGASSWSSR